MRPTTAREAQLAAWLQRLVARLLAAGGDVAQQLVATAAGRGALLVLDDAGLALDAALDAAGALDVRIAAAEGDRPARVETTGAALRAIVDGRRLLDAAVVDGSLDLRAPLAELLAFHELVLLAIARGPRDAALRELWREFDAAWPRAEAPSCAPIDRQAAHHGALRPFVPEGVRLARSPLADDGAAGAP
jgi:hypothetical protein